MDMWGMKRKRKWMRYILYTSVNFSKINLNE